MKTMPAKYPQEVSLRAQDVAFVSLSYNNWNAPAAMNDLSNELRCLIHEWAWAPEDGPELAFEWGVAATEVLLGMALIECDELSREISLASRAYDDDRSSEIVSALTNTRSIASQTGDWVWAANRLGRLLAMTEMGPKVKPRRATATYYAW